MGTLGAFIIFVMVVEHGWSYWLAIPVALVFSFLLGAGIERTLIRPIERRSALGVVIVTLGIFLVINALNAAIWGTQQLTPLTPFPNLPDDQFVLAEGPPRFAIRYGAIGTWVALALVVAVLWFFFQKTKLGLGYRAVASNRESSAHRCPPDSCSLGGRSRPRSHDRGAVSATGHTPTSTSGDRAVHGRWRRRSGSTASRGGRVV
jgi:branched-chain amino acid transport system permease protein